MNGSPAGLRPAGRRKPALVPFIGGDRIGATERKLVIQVEVAAGNPMAAGRHALILGASGIGQAINRILDRSGVISSCVGRHSRTDPELGRIASIDELPGLLPGTDFVILALPLTEHTKGIFGASELAMMGPGSWLVNLGRGALVDEQALITALQHGTIGGAALDVFTNEPLSPDSPLWDLPNAIISPHMSGDFRGWDRALADLFLAQLRRYLSGAPLLNVVDKTLGYVPGP